MVHFSALHPVSTFPVTHTYLLWMDEILHQIDIMGNNCLLVFTGGSWFQGFLGGANWISSIHTYLPSPSPECEVRFLFNGDFVDRGTWGPEVLLLLYAMKIKFPTAAARPMFGRKLLA